MALATFAGTTLCCVYCVISGRVLPLRHRFKGLIGHSVQETGRHPLEDGKMSTNEVEVGLIIGIVFVLVCLVKSATH